MSITTKRNSAGFSILETMVALFIMGIALMGSLSMILYGSKSNQQAYYRAQAAVLASEMANRIYANPAGDYSLQAAAVDACSVNVLNGDGGIDGCTNDEMARNDLSTWLDDLQRLLPRGQGVVCFDSTPMDGESITDDGCDNADGVMAIKVFWQAEGENAEPRFAIRVAPPVVVERVQ